MERSHIIGLLVLVFLLAVAGAITYYIYITPNDAANSDALRTLGDEEQFTDLKGDPVTFEDYEGNVRVVNVWASWSPFSAQELPLLESLATDYKDKGVIVIAINRNEPKELAERYLETLGTFTNLHVVIDPSDTYYKDVEGFAMPETVIYDARGTLVEHKRGNMTKDEMIRMVEAALQKTQ